MDCSSIDISRHDYMCDQGLDICGHDAFTISEGKCYKFGKLFGDVVSYTTEKIIVKCIDGTINTFILPDNNLTNE